jgi:hypothetical protein
MHADQNTGRLLLLRVRVAGFPTQSRLQLCQHGLADDRSHPVRLFANAVLYSDVIIISNHYRFH